MNKISSLSVLSKNKVMLVFLALFGLIDLIVAYMYADSEFITIYLLLYFFLSSIFQLLIIEIMGTDFQTKYLIYFGFSVITFIIFTVISFGSYINFTWAPMWGLYLLFVIVLMIYVTVSRRYSKFRVRVIANIGIIVARVTFFFLILYALMLSSYGV